MLPSTLIAIFLTSIYLNHPITSRLPFLVHHRIRYRTGRDDKLFVLLTAHLPKIRCINNWKRVGFRFSFIIRYGIGWGGMTYVFGLLTGYPELGLFSVWVHSHSREQHVLNVFLDSIWVIFDIVFSQLGSVKIWVEHEHFVLRSWTSSDATLESFSSDCELMSPLQASLVPAQASVLVLCDLLRLDLRLSVTWFSSSTGSGNMPVMMFHIMLWGMKLMKFYPLEK